MTLRELITLLEDLLKSDYQNKLLDKQFSEITLDPYHEKQIMIHWKKEGVE